MCQTIIIRQNLHKFFKVRHPLIRATYPELPYQPHLHKNHKIHPESKRLGETVRGFRGRDTVKGKDMRAELSVFIPRRFLSETRPREGKVDTYQNRSRRCLLRTRSWVPGFLTGDEHEPNTIQVIYPPYQELLAIKFELHLKERSAIANRQSGVP